MARHEQSDYEGLRRRCVKLSQLGWKQLAIAQAFGLTQVWVSRTLTKYRQLGIAALQGESERGHLLGCQINNFRTWLTNSVKVQSTTDFREPSGPGRVLMKSSKSVRRCGILVSAMTPLRWGV